MAWYRMRTSLVIASAVITVLFIALMIYATFGFLPNVSQGKAIESVKAYARLGANGWVIDLYMNVSKPTTITAVSLGSSIIDLALNIDPNTTRVSIDIFGIKPQQSISIYTNENIYLNIPVEVYKDYSLDIEGTYITTLNNIDVAVIKGVIPSSSDILLVDSSVDSVCIITYREVGDVAVEPLDIYVFSKGDVIDPRLCDSAVFINSVPDAGVIMQQLGSVVIAVTNPETLMEVGIDDSGALIFTLNGDSEIFSFLKSCMRSRIASPPEPSEIVRMLSIQPVYVRSALTPISPCEGSVDRVLGRTSEMEPLIFSRGGFVIAGYSDIYRLIALAIYTSARASYSYTTDPFSGFSAVEINSARKISNPLIIVSNGESIEIVKPRVASAEAICEFSRCFISLIGEESSFMNASVNIYRWDGSMIATVPITSLESGVKLIEISVPRSGEIAIINATLSDGSRIEVPVGVFIEPQISILADLRREFFRLDISVSNPSGIPLDLSVGRRIFSVEEYSFRIEIDSIDLNRFTIELSAGDKVFFREVYSKTTVLADPSVVMGIAFISAVVPAVYLAVKLRKPQKPPREVKLILYEKTEKKYRTSSDDVARYISSGSAIRLGSVSQESIYMRISGVRDLYTAIASALESGRVFLGYTYSPELKEVVAYVSFDARDAMYRAYLDVVLGVLTRCGVAVSRISEMPEALRFVENADAVAYRYIGGGSSSSYRINFYSIAVDMGSLFEKIYRALDLASYISRVFSREMVIESMHVAGIYIVAPEHLFRKYRRTLIEVVRDPYTLRRYLGDKVSPHTLNDIANNIDMNIFRVIGLAIVPVTRIAPTAITLVSSEKHHIVNNYYIMI